MDINLVTLKNINKDFLENVSINMREFCKKSILIKYYEAARKSCLRENICILFFRPHLKALRVDKHTYIFFSKSSKMLICMMTEKYFFSLYPFFTFESKFQRGVSSFVIRRFHISLCLSSHSGTLPIKHSCHL